MTPVAPTRLAVLLALTGMLLLAACKSTSPVGGEPNKREMKKARLLNHESTDAHRLEPMEIVRYELETNPSTGFQWTVMIDDESVAQIASQRTITNATSGQDRQMMGQGMWLEVFIRGLKPGKTKIDFYYTRNAGSSMGEPDHSHVLEVVEE